VTPEAEAILRAAPWRGNVRELRNLVERLALQREHKGLTIGVADLEAVGMRGAPPPLFGKKTYRELVDDFERTLLTEALAECGGNVAAAARRLGSDRGHVYRRMKALGVIAANREEED
jgi:DNA-binding NtrC family response regulator